MKEITINCCAFLSRSDLHRVLADALAFPDHYGNNLDALYDVLTERAEPTCITLEHFDRAREFLGRYAELIVTTISQAALHNPSIDFPYPAE